MKESREQRLVRILKTQPQTPEVKKQIQKLQQMMNLTRTNYGK